MKFLLLASMIVASSFASANDDGWSIKCFEKGNHGPDLAYIINVDGQGHPTADRSIQLEDCTRGRDSEDFDCRKRGELKKRCLMSTMTESTTVHGLFATNTKIPLQLLA